MPGEKTLPIANLVLGLFNLIPAPGPRDPATQEKCNIGGTNTGIGLRANIMCRTIGIAGNSSVTINYREEENYRNPPTVERSQ